MSSYGNEGPQELRRKHLDEYRGFERLSDEDLLASLDDPSCSPDRCCLIATELLARGADTKGLIPLLRWVLRGFDGNQTRYRAAIALSRLGEWDGEIQGALHHITERYPRTHADARIALELLENHGKATTPLSAGPAMNLPQTPALFARELPRITLPAAESRAPESRAPEGWTEERRFPTEELPALDLPAIPGEVPASRIKIRKSRKTLAYPSAKNAAILTIIIIVVGFTVAFIISQMTADSASLQTLAAPE